ncbi:MAG TPA: O-antigen ligase family protein [Puia sp.]|nr:O-antigen ligase family protein [Puia sp.]
MKDLFIINDTTPNKISYYLLILMILLLPIDRIYDEIILIFLVANTLIHPRKFTRTLFTPQLLTFLAIYAIAVIGTLYSPNKQQAFFELEKKMGLLLFPLVLAFNRLDLKKYKLNFLKMMCISCVITISYLFLDAARTILYLGLPLRSMFSSQFINQNFSSPIDIHATYLSMYVCFSICISIYLIVKENNRVLKNVYIFALLILIAGLIQLSSRAVVFSLLFIINICIPLILIKKSQKKIFIITTGLITLSVFVIFMNIRSYRERYLMDLVADLSKSGLNIDVIEPRVIRWQSALKLIGKAPFTGYGNGAEVSVLKEQYFKDRLFDSYLNGLNAHNQYISFLIQEGIAGLLIYLVVLYTGFAKSVRQKDFNFMCLLVIISVVSFSENILDTNKGVFFFSLFFTLFLLTNDPEMAEKPNKQPGLSPA